MGAETLMLILGSLLLLTAVIGGGLEVKEVKIPKIGGGTRTLAGITGALLIMWGAHMSHPPDHPGRRAGPENNTHSTVTFSLRDNLGNDQVSERVRVLIDGREVGTLTVTEYYPSSEIAVTVPSAGRYSYDIEAMAVFRDVEGQPYEIAGAGQGSIIVSDGKVFELASTITGNTWMAHMEEVAQ